MEQNVNNNQNATVVTISKVDRVKGWLRRTFTVKKVLGAAAFGATAYGIGYAVGKNKNKPVEVTEVAEEPKVEEPEEELLKQLEEMDLKYESETETEEG